MLYNPQVDALLPTDWFFKSQKIAQIADKFSITPEQALQHVWARAYVRHYITEYSKATSRSQLLLAKNIIKYNNKYQDILDTLVEKGRQNKATLDTRLVVGEWTRWFNEIAQFV